VAVKLRLMRMGKKKQPTYRVVAADSRSPRDGRFIEIVGTYAPRGRSGADPDAIIEIDNAKALRWLRQGATPTERVEKLLKKSGAWGEYRPGEAPVVAAATATSATATPATATSATDDSPADAT
jgi:small subunit ribosomal protein S16